MPEMYQEMMMTCDMMGVPLDEADYWYETYVEFVREEFNRRIDGKNPERINIQTLWQVVMKGLMEEYGVTK